MSLDILNKTIIKQWLTLILNRIQIQLSKNLSFIAVRRADSGTFRPVTYFFFTLLPTRIFKTNKKLFMVGINLFKVNK